MDDGLMITPIKQDNIKTMKKNERNNNSVGRNLPAKQGGKKTKTEKAVKCYCERRDGLAIPHVVVNGKH